MNAKKSLLSIVWACTDNVDTFCERNTCCSDLLCSGWTLLQTEIKSLEHKIGIDLTVSSTLKKPSKNYTCFILRHFWRAIYGFWRVKKKKKKFTVFDVSFWRVFDVAGCLGFAFEVFCVTALSFLASQSFMVLNCWHCQVLLYFFDRRWIKNNPKRLKIKHV